jgi:CRISPR-associated exonuclease Cas4
VTLAEEDFLPLSGVQHLVFCERQAALIHTEGLWADNVLTVEGSHRHRQVHDAAPRRERRGDTIIVRGLALASLQLGLSGIADVVEFHRVARSGRPEAGDSPQGVPLPGASGLWAPFPVEYKRGRPRAHRADEVQLCAQAFCLEEMLGVQIPAGALFYGKERRRVGVRFEPELRALTRDAAQRFHELVRSAETPPAATDNRCRACSLVNHCMPKIASRRRSTECFVTQEISRVLSCGRSSREKTP